MIDRKGKEVFIRKATAADIDRIYDIAREQAAVIENGTIKKHGLVSGYDKEMYKRCIDSTSYFYVLQCGGTVSSFLLGVHSDDNAPEGININTLRTFIRQNTGKNDETFILIKQIATSTAYHGSWHARMLYQHLKLLGRSAPIYAAIIVAPPNIASARLHEDAGFISAFEFSDEQDGFRRAYWRCSRIDEEKRPDLLLHQHTLASNLYIHEDELNWKKLSALFYISGALLAGMAFLFRAFSTDVTINNIIFVIASALALLGAGTSGYFVIALRSGVRYMLQRKQTLIDIDCEISKLNGVRMFVPVTMSPTAKYLRWIAILPLTFWLISFSIILFFWLR
jgi:ribosomal protein S18 acetylase RimI-like enzyme